MGKTLSKELLDDIFAIPRDGSNINDDDDGFISDMTSSSVPFENKASELSAEIGKKIPEPTVSLKVSVPEVPITPVAPSTPVGPKVEQSVVTAIPKVDVPKIEVPKVEKIDTPKIEVQKIEPPQEAEPLLTVSDEATEDTSVATPVKVDKIDYFKFPNGHCLWKFTSPSEKWSYFYTEKKSIVSKMLVGGEIPFEKYYKELRSINIDIGVDSYDTEEVNKRITEVMKWRDRVKFIQLHINSQYFGFKNFDDLLKGVLARIEYLRGKQEGLIYEHMSDYVGYVSELEGLFKSLEIVSKHLDAAYASLSRQAAIAQPFQEVDRFSNGVSSKPMTKELSRFDSLQKNANVSSSITADKPKEAEKSAESSRKGWNIF